MIQTHHLRIRFPLFALKLLPLLLCFPLFSLAQLKTISGMVTDESGNPIPDISVIVQNTKTGTKTDANGHYSIQAASGATIVFSSTNAETATLVIGSNNVYDIGLKLKVSGMSDVVVIGYGRQRKVNLVGAVSTVNVDEKMTARALPNITSGLSGLVPGLAATQSPAWPAVTALHCSSADSVLSNNSDPLIVVDGMPDVDINRVNVNDIEIDIRFERCHFRFRLRIQGRQRRHPDHDQIR